MKTPTKVLTAHIKDDEGNTVAIVPVMPKVFSSGKKGWFGNARPVVIDPQAGAVVTIAQVQLVIPHSEG